MTQMFTKTITITVSGAKQEVCDKIAAKLKETIESPNSGIARTHLIDHDYDPNAILPPSASRSWSAYKIDVA